ncbi:hypothetical protein [Chondrinema litorale]|uniref:hypothetical protein n=1 Tax=Chondrinema litorale TaxID=2994555 RepID=UPI00254301E7|nr:hypothetical protein [Chondrinema litorale]UZR96732.1 hypothetical protein OQ292_21550 [Chondrinema litorale]
MRNKKTFTIIYDTSDGNTKIGINLGCNGVIDVLFEPIDAQDILNPVLILNSLSVYFSSI